MSTDVHKLKYPAPHRQCVSLDGGKYYTILWSDEEMKAYRAAGGHFNTLTEREEKPTCQTQKIKPTTRRIAF